MPRHICRVTVRLSVIGVCVLGVGSGCAKETQHTEPTTPAVTANLQDRSQPVSEPDPSTDTFQGTTDPVEQQRPALDPVVLRGVRTAAQATFDRVVFEFQTAVPGYRVAYAEGPVRDCGSGEIVRVLGGIQLIVRMSPAQAHTETGTVTVKEQERHLTLPILKELEVSCDFEGEVSWVLGLSARKPYRVLELSEPARLVLDIQH